MKSAAPRCSESSAAWHSVADGDVTCSSSDETSDVPSAASPRSMALSIRCTALFAVAAAACWIYHSSGQKTLRGTLSSTIGLSKAGLSDAQQAAQIAATQIESGSSIAQMPEEDMHDGNACGDDEHTFGGLCYEKCSLLTNGRFPFRQSAWTCCQEEKCKNPFTLMDCCMHNVGFCSGFAIAGMAEGNKICPHKPGVCLEDEELFLGLCYMKCGVLTGERYPHRTGVASCCKSVGIACLAEEGASDGMPGNTVINATFAVGGGCNDGHTRTHCKPHLPQASLAEI